MSIKQLLTKILGFIYPTYIPYVPTVTATVTGFTANNIIFTHYRIGRLLIINGRFQVTAVDKTKAGFVRISLPDGLEAVSSGVGACGYITHGTQGPLNLSLRCDGGSDYFIQSNAGEYSTSVMNTGYYMLNAFLILGGGGA